MDCTKAAEILEQIRLGDASPTMMGHRQAAVDHILTCGCHSCSHVATTLIGDRPQISIGQQ